MADPISGGIGKASQQMMQEMQRQMQEVAQTQGTEGAAKADFAQVQKVGEVPPVQEVQKAVETQATRGVDVLKTAQSKGLDSPADAVKKVDKMDPSQKGFRRLLNQVAEGQNKLDSIIKMATSGKSYGQQDLLAIQASVYKFSQELELTSKVVEKATSGIKQTMQTQV